MQGEIHSGERGKSTTYKSVSDLVHILMCVCMYIHVFIYLYYVLIYYNIYTIYIYLFIDIYTHGFVSGISKKPHVQSSDNGGESILPQTVIIWRLISWQWILEV